MAGDETEYIELKVFDQDNSATHFRMHRTTKMEKLKRSYSETVRVPVTSLTFLFDGQRINDDETPMSLEMVQADVIDVCRIKPLEWTMNSLNKVAADVTRVEEARSSLSKNKVELEEEVQNLKTLKKLRKEMENDVIGEGSRRIVKKISKLLVEGIDESGSLQESCKKFRTSTEADFNNLAELVNQGHAQETEVRKLGKSVLKARNDFLKHFEDAATRMQNADNERNTKIQEEGHLREQVKKLEEQHRLLMQDKEALKEKLSNVSAELLSSRSDREELEKALEWTKNSLDKVAADVTRVEEARSSLSKNKEELEEEVQNLRPMAVLNENLRKEMEKSQKDVEALRRDRAKERNENEEMFSSLKNEMAKKLEEKEKVIVGQNSQLKALKTELSQEKQLTQSIKGDVPLEKNMLERKNSEQRKELSRYRSEIEHSQSELKKHRVNLTMMKSGLNILIGDPATPSSMVESLKLLRRSAMLVDIEKKIKAEKRPKDEYQEGPLEKKVKLEEKQEYFEEHVKQELDGEEAEDIPDFIPLVTSTSGEERGDNRDSD